MVAGHPPVAVLRQQVYRGLPLWDPEAAPNAENRADHRRMASMDQAVPFTHWPVPPRAGAPRVNGRARVTLQREVINRARLESMNYFGSTFGSSHLFTTMATPLTPYAEYKPGHTSMPTLPHLKRMSSIAKSESEKMMASPHKRAPQPRRSYRLKKVIADAEALQNHHRHGRGREVPIVRHSAAGREVPAYGWRTSHHINIEEKEGPVRHMESLTISHRHIH